MRRAAVVVLFSTPLLVHCMPDFDPLSAGANASQAGATGNSGGSSGNTSANGGVTSLAGSSSSAGMPSGAGLGGGLVNAAGSGGADTEMGGKGALGGMGGRAGSSGAGGISSGAGGISSGAGGVSSGAGGASGTSGSGGASGSSCGFAHPGATIYNGFDKGFDGTGFTGANVSTSVSNTATVTASATWNAQLGDSCPGALRYAYEYQPYVSSSDADEIGFGQYTFTAANWSSAKGLHVAVKVSPKAAPLSGIRVYVLSGSKYLYDFVFDDTQFKSGDWHDMFLPLVAGSSYDPTDVYLIGLEARLSHDVTGTSAGSPSVEILFDDLWLEPK